MITDPKVMSFTAANVLPFKVLRNKELMAAMVNKKIIPVHIQFMPTNRCNLKCDFCSCSKRNKKLEMPFEECQSIIWKFKGLGTQTCTLTGGGEPLLHKDFDKIVDCFFEEDIQIGLVTNGILLGKVPQKTLQGITWCRISCSDERKLEGKFRKSIVEAIKKSPTTDWAFSYVLSDQPNYGNLAQIIEFANNHNFTHVRVVSDLINPEKVDIEKARSLMENIGLDYKFVIWQGRKEFVAGKKRCLISLLKPVIAADGNLYACCGIQYMREKMDLDMVAEISMGKASDAMSIWRDQKCFDGSKCVRCYYDNYNTMLDALLTEVKHERFV